MRRLIIGLIGVLVGLVVLAGAAAGLAFLIPGSVYKTQIEAAASDALGRAVSISGPVSVSVLPRLAARAEAVTIANPPGFSEPAFAEMDALSARLALAPLIGRRVEITEFVLERPRLTLEARADGAVNWALGPDGADAPPAASGTTSVEPFQRRPGQVLVDAAFGDVRIVDGSARYIDGAAGVEHAVTALNIVLGLQSLADPLTLDGGFDLNGSPVSFDMRLDSPKGFLSGDEAPFRARLDSALATASLDGAFAESTDVEFRGDLDVALPDLRGLAAATGAELPPGDVFRAFQISGVAVASPDASAFEDARITFDDIVATGEARVALTGPRPKITGSLSVAALDVTPYMADAGAAPGPAEGGAAPAPAAASTAWSEDPIDVSALRLADAELAIDAARIKADEIVIDSAALTVTLDDGRLQADLADLSAYEGAGTLSAVVNARGATPSVALEADLSGLQVQPFLAAAADFDRVTGAGDAQLSVAASGGSQAAIMRSLSGDGGFTFRDGAVQGLNLAAVSRGIRSIAAGNFSGDAFSSGASTDFTALAATFQIAQGVARTEDLALESPFLRVNGEGDLNIAGQEVRMTLTPTIVGSDEGQGGADDLSGVSAPVKIEGPWTDVSVGIDQDAVEKAVERRARARLQDEAGSIIDRNLEGETGQAVRNLLGLPAGEEPDGEDEAEDEAEAEESIEDRARNALGGLLNPGGDR